MSGCIVFTKGSAWCKAGWAYRGALDGICEVLRSFSGSDALVRELSDEAGAPRTVQHVEVFEWEKEKRDLFRRATLEACGMLRARGPKGWNDPSFYPGFLRALEELEACAIASGKEEANQTPEPTAPSGRGSS